MSGSSKKKVNLTVDRHVFEMARQIAEGRGRSVSSLVEEFLARLTEDVTSYGGDWISDFHAKYLPKKYVDPTDEKVEAIRKKMLEKHS